ncbi:hypothetical protein E2542_SST17281 [Spatholobus suberectus]|nr:hypothetical protein E2542_SST17281 [Spatholobus suberectus]
MPFCNPTPLFNLILHNHTCATTAPPSHLCHKVVALPLRWLIFATNGDTRCRARQGRRTIYGGAFVFGFGGCGGMVDLVSMGFALARSGFAVIWFCLRLALVGVEACILGYFNVYGFCCGLQGMSWGGLHSMVATIIVGDRGVDLSVSRRKERNKAEEQGHKRGEHYRWR